MKKIITIAAAIAMATNIACAQDTFLEQEKQVRRVTIEEEKTKTTLVQKNDKKEQERRDARSDAKSSIQNMITQDIIRAEVLGKMPENRTDIEDEYTIYHANGGNGKITRQVNEYTLWYDQFRPSKNNPKKIDLSK